MIKRRCQHSSVTVIAFVDKGWPPQHSFIDGMLSTALPEFDSVEVYVCASGDKRERGFYRHLRAIGVVQLYHRRGLSRLANFGRALRVGWFLCARARRRGRVPILFVRNDPVYLFAASCLRAFRLSPRLVFQSSFPHEVVSARWLKRWLALALYRLSSFNVDAISAVSPVGLQRVAVLFPQAVNREWIPLLADMSGSHVPGNRDPNSDGLRFVYIGTHIESRCLETVFDAIRLAAKAGLAAHFRFLGGSSYDVERLRSSSCLAELETVGLVEIVGRVPRAEIPEWLACADIGLSLIPPRDEFQELSPTKLVEYMGSGLACLASRGIPLQEKFSNESGGALLTEFDAESICNAMLHLQGNQNDVRRMQANAKRYAVNELQYRHYIPQMLTLISPSILERRS